jgi:CheY-like chemotaxis protein
MDLVMPEMDGLETAREMRKRPELSGTKIIGASATVTDSAHKELFVSVCDVFVSKPVQIDLLLERIREQLGIVWNRATSELSSSVSVAGAGDAVSLLVVPQPDELREVHELALLGDVRKIQAWAARMEENNPAYRLFAGKLRELAGAYRTKAILALLDEHMGEEV